MNILYLREELVQILLSLTHTFTFSRHAEQLLFSCVSSKVTVYRLEWQCVFVLNKLYCVDMVVGRIVSMDVYVTCTVESCIQDTCITFHNKVGIFLISKGHNRLFW